MTAYTVAFQHYNGPHPERHPVFEFTVEAATKATALVEAKKLAAADALEFNRPNVWRA